MIINSSLGPSAHYKDQWVGFDDIDTVRQKGKYILENGFGGAAAWTVDLDDFTNRCCLEPFPLLRSLNRALGMYIKGVQRYNMNIRLFEDDIYSNNVLFFRQATDTPAG